MRQRISQPKTASASVNSLVSIPTLKPPVRGFGSESLQPSTTTSLQLFRKPHTHDISNISLRPQAKLSISQPGDAYEQEADSVAKQVMQKMAQSGNRQSIQRQEMSKKEEKEDIQTKSLVNNQSQNEMIAKKDLQTSIHQAKGGGKSLSDNIKTPMEQAFGADFGNVKIHTDSHSDQLNKSIQARAFTTGQDIFFRQGEYNPGSPTGQELLAHELTHVVQQNGDMVNKKPIEETTTEGKKVQNSETAEIDNSVAIHKQKFLDNYAVAKELIQGIDESLAPDKILAQLLQNFQKISFKYTMNYKQGIALLKGTREGDSQTLSEAFQTIAQEYFGIENIKIEEIKKPAISEEKDTKYQGMKPNCNRGKQWFLQNHYWVTGDGKVYEILFQSDKRPQVDMAGSENSLDSIMMPEGKYYKTDKNQIVYPSKNEYFTMELRMFEKLRNFINNSSKFIGQDMSGIVEQIQELLSKGADTSNLESLMRDLENQRSRVVTSDTVIGNNLTE